MNINIKVIPHFEQRYETPGDYWIDKKDVVQVRISELGNWRYEMLIAVHELVELLICKYQDISIAQIDKFDKEFEEDRKKGMYKVEDEPGDHINAPYRVAHFIATTVERFLASFLGVDWNDYAYACECLIVAEPK